MQQLEKHAVSYKLIKSKNQMKKNLFILALVAIFVSVVVVAQTTDKKKVETKATTETKACCDKGTDASKTKVAGDKTCTKAEGDVKTCNKEKEGETKACCKDKVEGEKTACTKEKEGETKTCAKEGTETKACCKEKTDVKACTKTTAPAATTVTK